MKAIKRIFDFLLALILAIPAVIILCLAALFVRIVSPGAPAIFRQVRTGYKRREFVMLKLRSMTDERDEAGNLLPSEMRLKWWGKLLRASNIDELPQILHILMGQMSWIGPRPLLPEEMGVMTDEEQAERQAMRPGITGWEAVNESQTATRRSMAEYDLFYVRNWSLCFDIRIFFRTVFIIFLKLRPDDSVRAPKLREEELINKDTCDK